MTAPEAHVLSHVTEWQLFCTLTYRREWVFSRRSRSVFVTFLRRLAGRASGDVSRLFWCLREEYGEQFGRGHHHALIGGLPCGAVNLGLAFWASAEWNALRGGGFAEVRLFDHGQAGVAYTLKCLGITSPADFYEASKFGQKSSSVTLSRTLLEMIRRGRGLSLRGRLNASRCDRHVRLPKVDGWGLRKAPVDTSGDKLPPQTGSFAAVSI